MPELILGKRYKILEPNMYRKVGDVGVAVRSGSSGSYGSIVLKFTTRNKKEAGSWKEPWFMYCPTGSVGLVTELIKNKLGNFPHKKKGVK